MMSKIPKNDFSIYSLTFGILFILQYIFREFLLPVFPFMPSSGANLAALGLIGTFSVVAMTVVAPMVIWESRRVMLRLTYFVASIIMGWGGIALGFLYPQYYLSTPWIIASLALCILTAVSILQVAVSSIKSLALLPLLILELISLYQYMINILTEYALIPSINLSTYLVYPSIYMLIAGSVSLLALSIYVRPRRGLLIEYLVGAVISILLSEPMYQLLIYNRFMQSIMGEVAAMGLGILAPPSYLPALVIVMGIYIFSLIALVSRAIMGEPLMGYYALAALIYIGTAFVVHALSIYFVVTITASVALINSLKTVNNK